MPSRRVVLLISDAAAFISASIFSSNTPSRTKDETFRVLLLALQASGASPGEIARLTDANINLDAGVIIRFALKTQKKTKRLRIIHRTPLLKQLIEKRLKMTKPGEFSSGEGKKGKGIQARGKQKAPP